MRLRVGDDPRTVDGIESDLEGWDEVAVDNSGDSRNFKVDINGRNSVVENNEKETDVDLDMLVAVWF